MGNFCRLGALQEEQIAYRLVFNAVHHVLIQDEGFLLVLDQRVFLSVAAETDALFEVIHREQVVFPLVVDDVEHDVALGFAHEAGADEVFLGFRLARGGVQEYFGVRADMVTYGKTVGGGLPAPPERREELVHQARRLVRGLQ